MMIINELDPRVTDDFEPIVLSIECESIEEFANLFGRFYLDDFRVSKLIREDIGMQFQHAPEMLGAYFALCAIGGKHFYWGE